MTLFVRLVRYAVVAGTAAAAVACSSSSGTQSASGAKSGSTPTPSPTPTITRLVDTQAALASMAVRPAQIGSGWKTQLLRDGTKVGNQVTLDMCGGGFHSERLRETRRQLFVSKGHQGFSNEVVGYHGSGAALAAREIAQRVRSCPKGFVPPALADEPALKWRLRLLPSRPEWLPGTLVVIGTETTADGQSETSLAVYQFRLNVLSAVYGDANGNAPSALVIKAADAAAANLRRAKGV
jgi:hypothetical protein